MDASTLSTAELKRALRDMGAPAGRLAQCLERPDFEALHREMIAHGPPPSSKPAAPAAPTITEPPPRRGDKDASNDAWSWQTWLLIAIAAYYLFGGSGSGGGSGGDGDGVHAATDSYITGHVAEVKDLPSLKAAMKLHSDGTGLPVVIDFYSPYCGPCRMIAPTYKRIAEEFKGRAALIKVDVNSAYDVGSEFRVRAMPTFHFYYNGQLHRSFQGADSRSLQSTTAELAERAERAGTYVGREVSADDLRRYYAKHDASKVSEASSLLAKCAPDCI